MHLQSFPFVFQIRSQCIISYVDNSYYKKRIFDENNPKPKIVSSNAFSSNSKRKMKKILDLWTWTLENTEPKYSFITLTISGKHDNKTNHYLLLKEWLTKINYRYGNPNFVWKAELQENGNIHYHIMLDKEIDWKLVRRQWNLIQKEYVDEYQNKMKSKYKNGYFFDVNYKNSKGETVDDKTQYKRYCKGVKANWRNPNSTDTQIVDDEKQVGYYISKYINKKEEDKANNDKKLISRWFGCNDELRLLKYAVISESQLSCDLIREMQTNLIKEIRENNNLRCNVIGKIADEYLMKIEKENRIQNLKFILPSKKVNELLIKKDIEKYEKLFELF